jgi:biopolymer transport protein ExbD
MADQADRFGEEEESEINLTPMLDVVFIMLIFFIVTAVFVREPGVDVQTPQAQTAIVPGSGAIYVAIDSANQIWIDRRQVDPDEVRSAIERLHSENPEGGVVIQSDVSAQNQALIATMDAAKAAGITEITIAADAP